MEDNIKRIVKEIAEECNLPIESEKEEVLYLRKNRKKENADREVCQVSGGHS